MQALALIFALAVLVEGLVEYFGAPIPTAYKRYVAALVGVALCIVYGADLLAILGFTASVPYVGAALTGLIVGRGSNYLNDLVTRLKVVTAPAVPVDEAARTTRVGWRRTDGGPLG